MTKPTQWPCCGCGATLSGKGGRRYCGADCRPRCSISECEKPTHGKTYCSTHHSRWKKYGDPEAPLARQPVKGKVCTVEACDQPMRKHPYCAGHYSMWKRYGEIRSWNYQWASVGASCVVCGEPVQVDSGRRKHCSNACQVADSRTGGKRPTELTCDFCAQPFLLNRSRTGRLQRTDTKWCPDCGRDSPEVSRFRRYGVTREQYEAATLAGCEICGRTDKPLHVDHDHNCCPTRGRTSRTCGKCVRGFLCGPCNRGIGLFFDVPTALERAALYLRKPSE